MWGFNKNMGGVNMARIKIYDLPKDMKISKDDLRKIVGGQMELISQYMELPLLTQTETREFNLLSNIIKTKDDTAKSTINNVR